MELDILGINSGQITVRKIPARQKVHRLNICGFTVSLEHAAWRFLAVLLILLNPECLIVTKYVRETGHAQPKCNGVVLSVGRRRHKYRLFSLRFQRSDFALSFHISSSSIGTRLVSGEIHQHIDCRNAADPNVV